MVRRSGHPLWLGQVMSVALWELGTTYEIYWLLHGGSWHLLEELEVIKDGPGQASQGRG